MSHSTRLITPGPIGAGIQTITGNAGGAVGPNLGGDVALVGAGTITVTGNPGGNSLTISSTGLPATYTADIGVALPDAGGNLNIVGGVNVFTDGSAPNTLAVHLDDDVTLAGFLRAADSITAVNGNIEALNGDIEATLGDITAGNEIIGLNGGRFDDTVNITAGGIQVTGPTQLFSVVNPGVVQINNTNTLFANNGTPGQVLIGGGLAPAWNTLTAGAQILITNANNSITIEADGTVAENYVTDAGTAVALAGVLHVDGSTNINTTGIGHWITINLDDDVTLVGSLTAGTDITATAGNITTTVGDISSGRDLSAVRNAVFGTNAVDSVDILGVLALHQNHHGVLQTDGFGVVAANNGADGTIYTGKGAGVTPAFRTLTAGAGIAITTTPGDITIAATGAATHPSFFAFLNPEMNVSGNNVTHLIGSVTATTIDYNIGGLFFPGDGAGTPASFTAATAGTYMFTANIGMRSNAASGGTEFRWSLALNGVNWYAGSSFPTRRRCAGFYGTSGDITTSGSTLMRLAPGDIVTLRFISAGGAQTDSVIDGSFAGALLF